MCKICEPDVREQEVSDDTGHYIAKEPIARIIIEFLYCPFYGRKL